MKQIDLKFYFLFFSSHQEKEHFFSINGFNLETTTFFITKPGGGSPPPWSKNMVNPINGNRRGDTNPNIKIIIKYYCKKGLSLRVTFHIFKVGGREPPGQD